MSRLYVLKCDNCGRTSEPGEKSCGPVKSYAVNQDNGFSSAIDLCRSCSVQTPCSRIEQIWQELHDAQMAAAIEREKGRAPS